MPEAKGIPEAPQMIDGGGGKAEASMEIKLLVLREFIRSTCMQEVLRATASCEGAGVFQKRIALLSELAIKEESCLACGYAFRTLRRPEE